mgnify:FL=1
MNNLTETVRDLTERYGKKPVTVATGANKFPESVSFQRLQSEMKKGEPILLLFGTGWGLEKNIIKEADYVLDPVEGVGEYNHLPVRAAIAIILDRLIAR